MFLGEALNKLKNLKSRAARTEEYIAAAVIYYEDVRPDYNYEEEMRNRSKINEEIIELKTRIQITNSSTVVDHNGIKLTLSELILRNAQLRIEMAFIKKQMDQSISEKSIFSSRTKDEIKKVFALGYDKASFKKEFNRLEERKEEIEKVLANANSSTILL